MYTSPLVWDPESPVPVDSLPSFPRLPRVTFRWTFVFIMRRAARRHTRSKRTVQQMVACVRRGMRGVFAGEEGNGCRDGWWETRWRGARLGWNRVKMLAHSHIHACVSISILTFPCRPYSGDLLGLETTMDPLSGKGMGMIATCVRCMSVAQLTASEYEHPRACICRMLLKTNEYTHEQTHIEAYAFVTCMLVHFIAGSPIHPQCLVCSVCAKVIEEKVVVKDDQCMHPACQQASLGRPCAACQKPLSGMILSSRCSRLCLRWQLLPASPLACERPSDSSHVAHFTPSLLLLLPSLRFLGVTMTLASCSYHKRCFEVVKVQSLFRGRMARKVSTFVLSPLSLSVYFSWSLSPYSWCSLSSRPLSRIFFTSRPFLWRRNWRKFH